MSGKRISKNGKIITEDQMNTALVEAAKWADELMEAEAKSRREKEYVVRDRLAGKIGVPARYLHRLQYQIDEMNDVKGSVYRALLVARNAYRAACEQRDRAYEAERELADARNSKFLWLADLVVGQKNEEELK